MTSDHARPAVFIDRDGTLIEEAGYLADLDRLAFFPYTVDAVRLLNRGGFAVVILSNQSGIARGIVRREFVEEAHAHIVERLRAGGATLDGVYYCPHHPEGIVASLNRRCACRKPQPGMLLQAAADLQLDLARSFVIGDRWQDVEAAHHAGARGILVRTGHGRREEESGQRTAEPAAVVDDLMAAAAWILGRTDA